MEGCAHPLGLALPAGHSVVISRINDPLVLTELFNANAPKDAAIEFEPAEWLASEGNIALRIGNDLAMFEELLPGIYQCHAFFESRGRTAIENGKAMLSQIPATALYCEVKPERREVLWFARRLGFTPIREVERPWGKRTLLVKGGP